MFNYQKSKKIEVFPTLQRSAANREQEIDLNALKSSFSKADLVVRVGGTSGSPTSYTVDSRLQGSLDGTTFFDIPSASITTITAAGNGIKAGVEIGGFAKIKVMLVIAFVGGSSPTVDTQVVANLRNS